MNINEIRSLVQIMKENGVSRMDIGAGEGHICIERGTVSGAVSAAPETSAVTVAEPAEETAEVQAPKENLFAVKSNFVGTVYLTSETGGEPFVSVGSHVAKGDTLCLVEAMKMYSEFCTDRSGTIAEICVANGQTAEAGQTLFLMKEDEA